MVRIELSNDFVLKSDAHNWTIARLRTFEKGKRAGETYDADLGHYGSLQSAISRLIDFRLRYSDAETLHELLALTREFRAEIKSAVNA